MPAKKTGKPPKTAAQKLAEKQAKARAAKIKAGKKLVAKGKKIGDRGESKRYSTKPKKQVKGQMQRQTGKNMITAGKKIQEDKGQGVIPKKRNLKVTKRSEEKIRRAQEAGYNKRKKK